MFPHTHIYTNTRIHTYDERLSLLFEVFTLLLVITNLYYSHVTSTVPVGSLRVWMTRRIGRQIGSSLRLPEGCYLVQAMPPLLLCLLVLPLQWKKNPSNRLVARQDSTYIYIYIYIFSFFFFLLLYFNLFCLPDLLVWWTTFILKDSYVFILLIGGGARGKYTGSAVTPASAINLAMRLNKFELLLIYRIEHVL